MKHLRLFKSLLLVLLAFSFCIPRDVFATTTMVSQKNIEEINKANASKYALSFIESIFDDKHFDSGDIVSFLDENNNLSGFCVDILSNEMPNGYVVIKFSNGEPVVSEFCVEIGAESPYKQIMKRNNITENVNIFYSIGPNDYHIYSEKEKMFVGLGNEKISITKFEMYKSEVRELKAEAAKIMNERALSDILESEEDNIIVYSSLGNSDVIDDSYVGTVKDRGRINDNNMAYYCSNDVEKNGLKYACAIVALCNAMKYLRLTGFTKISSDFSTLYKYFWDKASTTSSGSTYYEDAEYAAVRYLQELGYVASYDTYWFSLYSDFKRDIKNGAPCTLSYAASNILKGHAVFVPGYLETTSYQYLCVVDGWYDTHTRYLNYNGYNYARKNGWALAVAFSYT